MTRSTLFGLLSSAAFLWAIPADAQVPPSRNGYPYFVVTSCGTTSLFSTLVGQYAPATVDAKGNLCVPASSGAVADQTGSNASDGQATSTANQHAIAFEYIFNGATWDRARGINGVRFVMPQDVRLLGQSLSAAANSTLIIPLNGAGTLGLAFTGLTASGATITFSVSNDGGTTYTAVGSFDAATGVPSPTYNKDGQTRIDVGGRTNAKLTVTTGGTGTITVSATASPASSLVANTAPLPPGNNLAGAFNIYQNGAALSTTNPIFEQTVGPSMQAPGTSPTVVRGIQGAPGAIPVTTAPATGTCADTVRTLNAGTSNTLLSAGTYKSVSFMDIGTNPATFTEGTAAAVVGNGMALSGAQSAGFGGGFYSYTTPPTNAVQGISTSGTTIIVKVCN